MQYFNNRFECNFKCYILIIVKMDFKIFKVLKRKKSVCLSLSLYNVLGSTRYLVGV